MTDQSDQNTFIADESNGKHSQLTRDSARRIQTNNFEMIEERQIFREAMLNESSLFTFHFDLLRCFSFFQFVLFG